MHRDVKTENIYRTDEGHWKLGDFGSALEVEALEEGQALHPEGTLSYSAPEYVQLWRQSTFSAVKACTGPQASSPPRGGGCIVCGSRVVSCTHASLT